MCLTVNNCEGECFMENPMKKDNVKVHTDDMPYAFVDGSFNPNAVNHSNGLYGYGGFLCVGDETYPLMGSGNRPDMVAMRNIAGEISGAMAAVEKAEELGLRELKIFYDYKGIEQWATGSWRTNKAATAAYADFMNPDNRQVSISFQHVKGHTGIEGNEMADVMAKNAVGINLTDSQQKLLDKALSRDVSNMIKIAGCSSLYNRDVVDFYIKGDCQYIQKHIIKNQDGNTFHVSTTDVSYSDIVSYMRYAQYESDLNNKVADALRDFYGSSLGNYDNDMKNKGYSITMQLDSASPKPFTSFSIDDMKKVASYNRTLAGRPGKVYEETHEFYVDDNGKYMEKFAQKCSHDYDDNGGTRYEVYDVLYAEIVQFMDDAKKNGATITMDIAKPNIDKNNTVDNERQSNDKETSNKNVSKTFDANRSVNSQNKYNPNTFIITVPTSQIRSDKNGNKRMFFDENGYTKQSIIYIENKNGRPENNHKIISKADTGLTSVEFKKGETVSVFNPEDGKARKGISAEAVKDILLDKQKNNKACYYAKQVAQNRIKSDSVSGPKLPENGEELLAVSQQNDDTQLGE